MPVAAAAVAPAIALRALLPLDAYREPNAWVDYEAPAVEALYQRLGVPAAQDGPAEDAARALYEFVRDGVAHSWDVQETRVTRTASEVAEAGHGICYAKSYLLAALLRRAGLAAGLCYQRLRLDENDPSSVHCLHGLNAVWLEGRWVRLDARGNKPGVDAQFSMGEEQLAFPIRPELGECDYPRVYAAPPACIADALCADENILEVYQRHLPTDLSDEEAA